MADFVRKPPAWFWIVAGVLLFWNLLGGYACVQQFRLGAAAMGPPSDYDRALYASLPAWLNWDFALGEATGIGGAIALLVRRAVARPLFVLSLITVVIQFGYQFALTDMIAAKGVWVTYFPLFIVAICLVQLWLATVAIRRGWLV